MKLEKFKQRNPKKIGIAIFTITCVLLIAFVFIYSSFASFQTNETRTFINGNVVDPGDLYFAFYVDGEISSTVPAKGKGYTFDKEKSVCTNGATVEWLDDEWAPKINNLTQTRTKCTLYFKEGSFCEINPSTGACTILAKGETEELKFDNTDDNNLRYVGANPNNYVDIGEVYTRTTYALNKDFINALYDSYRLGTSNSCIKYMENTLGMQDSNNILASMCSNLMTKLKESDPYNFGVGDFYSFLFQSVEHSLKEYDSLDSCLIDFVNKVDDSSFSLDIVESLQLCKVFHEKDKPILWRIVGVFPNVVGESGIEVPRIKLVRSETIGNYAWDTSSPTINDGFGVNEWSQADLMKLLNPGYESESIGGSLWWNNQSGNCYNGFDNMYDACDFTYTSFKEAQKLVSDSLWDISAINDVSDFMTCYEQERSGNISNCKDNCNDTIQRTTKWNGKIGLISASDYLFGKEWLYAKEYFEDKIVYDYFQYMLNPSSQNGYEAVVAVGSVFDPFYLGEGKLVVSGWYVSFPGNYNLVIKPSFYVHEKVIIESGTGTLEDPFILSL